MGKSKNQQPKTGLTIEDLRNVEGYGDLTDEQLEELLRSIRRFAEITYKLYWQMNAKGKGLKLPS